MTAVIIAMIIAAEVVGLYWWRRTSKRRSPERRIAQQHKQQDKLREAFRDLLLSLREMEGLPTYPPQGEGMGSEFVTFYTIVRGDAAKVAAVISEKFSSYEETSERSGDPDAMRAANTIRGMMNTRSDNCGFHWGTHAVEYRLHRDQSNEFMFVEIMKRPR